MIPDRDLGGRAAAAAVVLLLSVGTACAERPQQIPDWVAFPDDELRMITPEEGGLDARRFRAWARRQRPNLGVGYGGQRPRGGGVVLARGGYLIRTWGDPDFKFQSASLGKMFTRMALQLALDEGRIRSVEDPVHEYWTGEGQLAPHKVLTVGHHKDLTFRHLRDMVGGFPVTNGHFWRERRSDFPGIPEWADWTGDPDHDNYAHAAPGRHDQYSSGGYWRLSQALTAICGRDLKELLDEKVMGPIGIPADRWDWLFGAEVRDDAGFYPESPGYGGFVDRPTEIDGAGVRGGGGWVVMSARDFARLGLLIATGGVWGEERLISRIEAQYRRWLGGVRGGRRLLLLRQGRRRVRRPEPGGDGVLGHRSGSGRGGTG